MKRFVAPSLQFVARCIACTRSNLQRVGHALSFFPLLASETCREHRYDRAAKTPSCCRLNQLRSRSLHILLQSLL
jgi:hypothetical protein